MSVTLQYIYAHVNSETYECDACITTTNEMNDPSWILVPHMNGYVGKYYNPADGLFYYEPEYITVFDPEA